MNHTCANIDLSRVAKRGPA